MTVSPNGRTRHLARFGGSVCGATDCCSLGMNACLPRTPPRTPHQGKTRASWGTTGRAKGGDGPKNAVGVSCTLEISGEIVVTHWLCHVAVRTPRSRVDAKYPRNASFLPRFGVFLPRRCFCDFWPISISLSIFQRREERKSAKTGKQALPRNFGVWQKNNPGIFRKILRFGGLFFKRNPMLVRVCGRLTPFPPFPGPKRLTTSNEGSQ